MSMEKGESLPVEDEFLVLLRETGECRIPYRREAGEEASTVELIDRTREYAHQLADELGIKIITYGQWTDELGWHTVARTKK